MRERGTHVQARLNKYGSTEDGVITSVGSGLGAMVFVRYTGDQHSKATRAQDLTLLADVVGP